ncbi:catechol 2,3-dioxygenase-like lactoylglutathione lyase family enzyme [Paraburkholderia sp. CI3]
MQPSKPPLLSFVMQLDHATIVTADLDSARRFFVDIAGFTEGARLPFSVDDYWLYASGRPVVHLIAAPASGAACRVMPRIDHIAFRLDSAGERQALLERLDAHDIGYQTARCRRAPCNRSSGSCSSRSRRASSSNS